MSKVKKDHSLGSFLIELLIYAVLVVAYLLLVLHFLNHWLTDLCEHHRYFYSFGALFLIIGQGVLLETITTALLSLIHSKIKG